MDRFHIRTIICVIIILCQMMCVFGRSQFEKSDSEHRDLGNFLDVGYILQDYNEDSVIDAITVKVVVPEDPSKAEIACAANIAVRLGYETSGMDFDFIQEKSALSVSDTLPVIAVSHTPYLSNHPYQEKRNVDQLNLAPGQGRIEFYSPEEYPNYGLITVRGADDTGLMAAGTFLAGRYPNLWRLDGKTLTDVRDQFEIFLRQRKLDWNRLTINAIDVDAARSGILKLFLDIEVEEDIDFQRAVRALKGREYID